MTTQLLSVELSNLIQESKRKNQELRQAAEKSLNDLKSLGQQPEAQVAEELSSRPAFLSPFLIACGTRNVKFCTIAVVCLQRMIISRALAKSRLKEVLEAFREASHLGIEIQLKILQALPALLQNYADGLQGKLLGETLLLCSILQSSKTGVVNNTAAATLQQLVISTFDKVVVEDDKRLEILATDEAPCGEGTIPVRPAAFDAYRVFLDICFLTEGLRPQFLRFNALPQTFGLELIESVLTNHSDIFLTHPEQAQILCGRLVPLVIKSLGERQNFPTTVRITRVLYTLLRKHLTILSYECETALGLLTHMLDPEAAPQWKRALCMEVFRGICAEPALIRKIYAEYDAKQDKKPIMKDMVAALTRLATEKPSVIGLSSQSTAPVGQTVPKDSSSEQAALEAGGVAGIIGGAVGLVEVTVPGLSTQWSIMRVPCIDQLDKTEPPSIPESYIYHLTLTCINSFSEGLAKFILPFSVSGDGLKGFKKRSGRLISGPKGGNGGDNISSESPARTPSPSRRTLEKRPSIRRLHLPLNPLTLESHPLHNEILISAGIVETCWPALLASCSTFLYAALDSELYHSLVRSFQKFAHVAGLLRLSTPRDAFLTTLGKAAVPSNILSANIAPSYQPAVESSNTNPTSDKTSTADPSNAVLNTRNLLCLRALLNLGIALGPTLEDSWSIILETLQQADYVIYASSRKVGRQGSSAGPSPKTELLKGNDNNSLLSNIGQELAAVEVAAAKMFESTKDFPDETFLWVLSSLCSLLEVETNRKPGEPHADQSFASKFSNRIHKRSSSFSSARVSSQVKENVFAIAKLGELAQINIHRLIGPNPKSNGWDMLVAQLIAVASSRNLSNAIRIKAAEVLNDIAIGAARAAVSEPRDNAAEVQKRILAALRDEVTEFGDTKCERNIESFTRSTEFDIHRAGLDTLNSILEHSGQSLIAGWDIVFDIITSIFHTAGNNKFGLESIVEEESAVLAKSPKLIRSSFNSLQLICSDFLSTLPIPCILVLVDALYAFCIQKEDLNISLTTVTFFWNVSDFLQTKGDSTDTFIPRAKNEHELMQVLRKSDVVNPNADLWMFLLLRLTAVSKDSRSEVRNGSIQTLFRIFDTYGPRLSAQTWRSCLNIVVFKMMDSAGVKDSEIEQLGSEQKLWDDTVNLALGGIGNLYCDYFEIFSQQSDFRHTWSTFNRYLESLLNRRSMEVSTATFKVMGNVLEKAAGYGSQLDPQCLAEAWRMWSSQTIDLVDNAIGGSRSDVQNTLTAFVDAFKPLYRLLEPSLDAETIEKALGILRDCILHPDIPQYIRDTDHLTPLQASVLGIVREIRTDISQLPTLLLNYLSFFSSLAYTAHQLPQPRNPKQQRPSYIAFSSASIKQIEAICIKHVRDMEIYSSGALAEVLRSLKLPISLKYDSPTDVSKKTALWRQSTNTALIIARQVLPAMGHLAVEDKYEGEIWQELAAIVSCVVYVNCSAASVDSLALDEQFDIQAFGQLWSLIIPCLGRSVVPERALKQLIFNIYKASFLYDLEPAFLEDQPTKNLERVSKVVPGKTSEPQLQGRARMAYVCLDELFGLFSVKIDDPDEVIRLACITSPYLILRVALVLRIFISDQPLRGRMPQPICQRKELLYILKRLVDLSFSSGEISSKNTLPLRPCIAIDKPHLLQLFPFLSQAIAVAQGDQELLMWLSKAFGELGGGALRQWLKN